MSYVIHPLILTCSSFAVPFITVHLNATTSDMILRYTISQQLPQTLFALLLLLSSAVHVVAEDFNCQDVKAGGLSWDLTSLSGEHTASRTRETPPTTMLDELRFNLCGNLPELRDVPEGDQASSPPSIRGTKYVNVHIVLVWDKCMLDEDEPEGRFRPGDSCHTCCAVVL